VKHLKYKTVSYDSIQLVFKRYFLRKMQL